MFDPAEELLAPVGAPVETWWFATWGLRRGAALWEQITVHRPSRATWYAAALIEPEAPSVLVVDDEMPWPRPERYLEIRGRGIWSHHVCEEPLRRWSVGIEAAGVAHRDPSDGLDRGWGDPDGIAADLEWEATAEPIGMASDGDRARSWAQPCRVDGTLERVGEVIAVDHASGARGRWSGAEADRPGRLVVVGDVGLDAVAVEGPTRWSPRELPRHAAVSHGEAELSVSPLTSASWRGELGLVTSVAPVALAGSDGRDGYGVARWIAAG